MRVFIFLILLYSSSLLNAQSFNDMVKQSPLYVPEINLDNIEDNQIYISAGLKPGEIIAIAGVPLLQDGRKVTLLDKQTQRFN